MLEPGDILENWEIVGKLGQGGMGSVYRARNRVVTDMFAAVKVTRPTDFKQARERFEREVKALLRLQHPYVVRVQGVGEDQDRGLLWFAMDLVEGMPLEDHYDRGPMPLREALPLFIALCDGLAHAHERGVAHRDLKPANVLLKHSGEPVLVDFGISASADGDRLTRTGMVIGTPQYMPPEALEGRIAEPTLGDVYALAQMMIEALDGQAVFPFDEELTSTQNALRIMHNKVATGRLAPRVRVPAELVDLLGHATEVNPLLRLGSIAELGQGLRQVAAERGIAVYGGNTLTPMNTTAGRAMSTMAVTSGPTTGSTAAGAADTSEGKGNWLLYGIGGIITLVAIVLLLIGLAGGGLLLAMNVWGTDASEVATSAGEDPVAPPDDGVAAAPDTDDELVEDEDTDAVDGTAQAGSAPPPQPSGRPSSTRPRTPRGPAGTGSPTAAPDDPGRRASAVPDDPTEPSTRGTEPAIDPPDPTDEPDEGGGTAEGTEADPASGSDVPAAAAVQRIEPRWRTVLGIQKGMGDGKLARLLGTSESAGNRWCKTGESARKYRGGSITVCRAIVGGARRVHLTTAAGSQTAGLPSDGKLGLLGQDKPTVKAMIGDPASDQGGVMRYDYGRAKLYLSGDTVSSMLIEL